MTDLNKVFKALRKNYMKSIPKKYVFGAEGEKFLGFMLTHRGIEVNLNKCQVIIDIKSPKNIKELQKLVGKLTMLSLFMPRLIAKTKPIIQLLKKASRFQWTQQCEDMFV